MSKETLQTGTPTGENPALDLMTFLLTKKLGSEEEAKRKIGEWSSTYTNETVGAFALCTSEGIDVLVTLDQVRAELEELTTKTRGEEGIPYVMPYKELKALIDRKMPGWIEELGR